jgi:hypothetical protein
MKMIVMPTKKIAHPTKNKGRGVIDMQDGKFKVL